MSTPLQNTADIEAEFNQLEHDLLTTLYLLNRARRAKTSGNEEEFLENADSFVSNLKYPMLLKKYEKLEAHISERRKQLKVVEVVA